MSEVSRRHDQRTCEGTLESHANRHCDCVRNGRGTASCTAVQSGGSCSCMQCLHFGSRSFTSWQALQPAHLGGVPLRIPWLLQGPSARPQPNTSRRPDPRAGCQLPGVPSLPQARRPLQGWTEPLHGCPSPGAAAAPAEGRRAASPGSCSSPLFTQPRPPPSCPEGSPEHAGAVSRS